MKLLQSLLTLNFARLFWQLSDSFARRNDVYLDLSAERRASLERILPHD